MDGSISSKENRFLHYLLKQVATIAQDYHNTSGRFSLDSGFIGSFFTYIVPTVGLLAAQLSGTFRWALEPILRIVK